MKYFDTSIQIFEEANNEENYWKCTKKSYSTDIEVYRGSFTNSYLSIPDEEIFRDLDDSIVENKLLENQGDSSYFLHSENKELFDAAKYIEDQKTEFNKKRFRFIIKVPSRVVIANEKEFHVLVRLMKTDNFVSENTVVKLISNSFYFSESIVQLTENEKEIKLVKRTPCMNYLVRIKVYYNNEVVEDKEIDIYERK
jgi:hypothetical protein